jgi:uncharacterized protein (DUF2141 family)
MVRHYLVVGILLILAHPCQASETTLVFSGKDLEGCTVYVSVHRLAESFPAGEGILQAKIEPAKSPPQIQLTELAPGRYAIAAFCDKNGNGTLDANFVGMPTEPYGFSRDARGVFGPPSWEDAAVELGDEETTLTISLQ